MSNAPSLPWYRHRWPWILIAGPAVVVVASMFTIWFAMSSNDGLVADDYYKQGVSINRTLARTDKAGALGMVAQVSISAERVSVALKSNMDLPGKVRFTIAHPTRAGQDQTVLIQGVGGVFQGALRPLLPGRWQVILTDEANTWRMASEIQLPEQKQIIIHPTEKGQQ